MARKRMFDKTIVDDDRFIEMPSSTKALYFLLGMEADDDGFITPKRVMRVHGISEDDLKVLISKGYVIAFESGVIVITHWNLNNYIDRNKKIGTRFKDELALLGLDNEKAYVADGGLPEVKPKLTQYRIEENRVEEKSIEEKRTEEKICRAGALACADPASEVFVDEGHLPVAASSGIAFVSEKDKLIDDVIDYLNLRAGKNFRKSTKKYRRLIGGRIEAGFTAEEFKYVIDVKCLDWMHNVKMKKFLTPDTLFAEGNFDKYLNQEMPEMTLRDMMRAGTFG